jgi:UDP-N-acetylglucosamine 2-epimerase (non-hydrolysing)
MKSTRSSSLVSVIVGARPNFVKIARLIPALEHVGLRTRLIHTGQHYDERMSQTFFDELSIPRPAVNLGVGSGTHIWQITEVMRCLEQDFLAERPKALLVVGDVNSTLAATLTANKLGIPVGHVEAGLRSFDRTMPEEVNRIVTDAISDWLFTSEPCANKNLEREGIAPEKIHFVGNVMIDTLFAHIDQARRSRPYEAFELCAREYVVLTLHRPSNVDDVERLGSILTAAVEIGQSLPILLPVHPRTRQRLAEFGEHVPIDKARVRIIEPQGYLAMLGLMDASRFVMTDSGGIQEETTALRIPCLTLRENTERPVTVDQGSNRLVGWRKEDIVAEARKILHESHPSGTVPEKWDGAASSRIADILKVVLG